MKSIKCSAAILFLSLATAATAQQKIDPTLEVKRDFDVNLLEIQKGKLKTRFDDSISKFRLNFDYSIFDKPMTNLYEFTPLPSARPEEETTVRSPLFYASGGINLPFNPHLQLYLQPRLSAPLSLVFYGKHNSFYDKIPLATVVDGTIVRGEEKASAPSSRNSIGANFGYNYKGGKLGVNLDYGKCFHSYYGYDQVRDLSLHPMPEPYQEIWEPFFSTLPRSYAFSFMKDTLSHSYNKVSAGVQLESVNDSHTPFYYNIEIKYGNLNDLPSYGSILSSVPVGLVNQYRSYKENFIKVKGSLGYIFATHHRFMADICYQASNSVAVKNLDRYDLEAHPYYVFNQGKWIFELGLRFNKYVDPSLEAFNVFFKGNLSYELMDSRIWVYALIDGKNNFRTYQQMMQENPWITPNIELRNTEEPIIIRAGLRGQVSDRLAYNIWGGYNKYINHLSYIYLSDIWAGPLNTFSARYKDMNKYGFGGELYWKSKDFEAGAEFEYFRYKNRDSSTVYNLPALDTKWFARYNWRGRVYAGAELHYRSGCNTLLYYHPYSEFNPDDEGKIQPFTILNLNFTYTLNKKISFYLLINNVLNTNESYHAFYLGSGTGAGIGATINL